jgi:DNA-directed RNA polymerase subunit RPC12/RpoP
MPQAETRVLCPKCGKRYRFGSVPAADQTAQCTECGTSFLLLQAALANDQAPAVAAPGPVPRENKDRLAGQEIGGCRIEKKIGQGGMGSVYKARHLALDIPVAVKILSPRQARDKGAAVERFIREARSAARLRHQNLVGVLNVGTEKGVHFLVMDFVDGESLASRLHRE